MPKVPPIGKRFEKGNNANPLGAKAHDPVKKAIKKLTSKHLEEIVSTILLVSPDQLKKESESDPTVMKTWIASAALTGIKKGDLTFFNSLIDRIHGRVKQRVELTGNEGGPLETSAETEEERKLRKERIAQLTQSLKDLDDK
jgi:hypothetical protein